MEPVYVPPSHSVYFLADNSKAT